MLGASHRSSSIQDMTAEEARLPARPRLSPPSRFVQRCDEGLSWRWRFLVKPWLKRRLGIPDHQWGRVAADRATTEFVLGLDYRDFNVVEISATSARRREFGFRSYRSTDYPDYDLCEKPLDEEAFDLIIAEQVLEHVLWPYRAVCNAFQMLRPGGWFVVATPFPILLHAYPNDCTRWTETGLEYLLMGGASRTPRSRLAPGAIEPV
jgi:SAM-dependent methyltransferase